MARTRMARTRIVSVVSGKGGVGKTTTSLSIASYWPMTGHQTYLVLPRTWQPQSSKLLSSEVSIVRA